MGLANDDRLIIILSTPRQQDLAWRYGHNQQVLMDGTFGVCSSCVLVFFLMVIDENNVGLPIATIIFTPKKDAKAGHASYDKAILTEVLERWKVQMGTWNGETFHVGLGNTDNNKREQHALQQNWPNIKLILCVFHTWQAWRNALNRCLGCIPKGPLRQKIRSRLAVFLMTLLQEISVYSEAIAAYNRELQYFRSLGMAHQPAISKTQSKASMSFLLYLNDYLRVESFWKSWSRAGVIEAAATLNIPETAIARTNNHLESFNGRIKSKYFSAYQRSGRLPRLDVWVLLFGTTVLGDFFNEYDERHKTTNYYGHMREAPKAIATNITGYDRSATTVKDTNHYALRALEQEIEDDNYIEEISTSSDPCEAWEIQHDELEESTDDSDDWLGMVHTVEDISKPSLLSAGYEESSDGSEWLGIIQNGDEEDSQASQHSGEQATCSETESERDWSMSGPELGDFSDSFEVFGFGSGDVALDSSHIRPYLPVPPPDIATVPPANGSVPPLSSSPISDNSNAQAIAWQDMLVAEDEYIRTLRALIDSSPSDFVQQLSTRLSSHIFARLVYTNTVDREAFPRVSPLPESDTITTNADSLNSELIRPFLLPQKKERRHESRGVR